MLTYITDPEVMCSVTINKDVSAHVKTVTVPKIANLTLVVKVNNCQILNEILECLIDLCTFSETKINKRFYILLTTATGTFS